MKNIAIACAAIFAAVPTIVVCADDSKVKYSWNVTADNEGLWNMTTGKGAYNGLLTVEGGVSPWQGGTVEASAIASYTTGAVADDIQGVSNLDAGENRSFRLLKLGIGQQFGNWTLFAGLRNIDFDYFTTDYTSFFTGSSYGNFPTLSLNHPLPTYPLSALGVHVEYAPSENIVIKESLYAGSASDRFKRQFRVRPVDDGFFNIGSVTYTAESDDDDFSPVSYMLSYSIARMPEEYGDMELHYAMFGNVEQPVATVHDEVQLGILAQGSWCPVEGMCRGYAAVAMLGQWRNGMMAGVACNRVFATNGDESDLEFTFSYPLLRYFTLTPSLHCIFTEGSKCNVVGMLRVSFTIGQ